MKVVLLVDVAKIGRKGTIVNVPDGFATNSLIPQKKAVLATPEMEKKLKEETKQREADIKRLQDKVAVLKDETIETVRSANEKGHLFASIHEEEIARIIFDTFNIAVPSDLITIEKKTIKDVGEHIIHIQAGNKKISLKILVKNK